MVVANYDMLDMYMPCMQPKESSEWIDWIHTVSLRASFNIKNCVKFSAHLSILIQLTGMGLTESLSQT